MPQQSPDLIGRTITDMRPMTDAELALEGWIDEAHGGPTIALVLDDGTVIYPSRDPEGNGPGELFGVQNGVTVTFGVAVKP